MIKGSLAFNIILSHDNLASDIVDLPQVGYVGFGFILCCFINRYLASSRISCTVIVITVTILLIRKIVVMI